MSITQVIAGLLTGIGTALNWTCYGAYIGKCSDSSNRGRYNGYIWNFVMLAVFFSVAIPGYIIGTGGYLLFYCIVPCLTATGGIITLGMPEPDLVDEVLEEVEMTAARHALD